jgi:hypothetical protein
MYAGSGISTRTGGRPINWCGHENGYVPRAETLAGWFRLVPVGPGRPFVSIEPLESVLQKILTLRDCRASQMNARPAPQRLRS